MQIGCSSEVEIILSSSEVRLPSIERYRPNCTSGNLLVPVRESVGDQSSAIVRTGANRLHRKVKPLVRLIRYASLPTLNQAQNIILYTLAPFAVLCSIVAFVGFIALAYFYNCNPIESGEIVEVDHITILFARDILQPTPGLFGLYVSCIMSATLSTLSSGMNSMAAAIYEDFLKSRLDGKITDTNATRLNKVSLSFNRKKAGCLRMAEKIFKKNSRPNGSSLTPEPM
ncbi:unnamed protein product [Caenorhabditis bovis]|uniref:Uncharacterized protein n=1 Tax=Caenorhabditis bovis TaxID=2654633 RepID=A0A8S1EZE9_9PELO|nr:unnamed protein product [Caenorhabditis bovis]